MIRKTALATLVIMGFIQLSAQVSTFETVLLKNGSVLEGYISRQRPGESFSFMAEKAILFMPMKEVKDIITREVPVNELPPVWYKWAENNSAINERKQTFTFSDITTLNHVTFSVRLLEKGEIIKYLDLSPHTFTLNWDTIQLVKKERRDKLALSGTNDVLLLNNGQTLEGQIVEQIPGKSLKLIKQDGLVEVIDLLNVSKMSITKMNSDQSLFEQYPTIDILHLDDNSELKGLIVERNLGEKEDDCYLVVETEKGTRHTVKTNKVKEYYKEINTLYKPETDILIKEGDFLINRQHAVKSSVIEEKKMLSLSTDTTNIFLHKDSLPKGIIIETYLPGITSKDITLVKINSYRINSKNVRKGFTYESMVKNSIAATEIKTSANKTTRIIYPSISTPGLYALYLQEKKEAYLFYVR